MRLGRVWRRLFLSCALPTGAWQELLGRRGRAGWGPRIPAVLLVTGANLRVMRLREGLPRSPPPTPSPPLGCSCPAVPFPVHQHPLGSCPVQVADGQLPLSVLPPSSPLPLPPTQARPPGVGGAHLRGLFEKEPVGVAGCVCGGEGVGGMGRTTTTVCSHGGNGLGSLSALLSVPGQLLPAGEPGHCGFSVSQFPLL